MSFIDDMPPTGGKAATIEDAVVWVHDGLQSDPFGRLLGDLIRTHYAAHEVIMFGNRTVEFHDASHNVSRLTILSPDALVG